MRLFRKLILGASGALLALITLGTASLAIAARTTGAPEGLGVRDGRLAPCPNSPNCVSSQATDALHQVEPLPLTGDLAAAQARIRTVLAGEPRVEILRDEPGYLHAIFRSAAMAFPDDVELYLDSAAGLIHIRSASRLGYGDMGVNRARVERLWGALR